jgi:hypothetical protein
MTAKTALAALLLLLVIPAGASSVRCTTYAVKSLGRLQTLCDDGTRATHTYNKTLSRWESTITPPSSTSRWKRDPKLQLPKR